jgi:integrase
MASAGYRKRVSPRTGRISYQVWWVADDGSQGARTVITADEAKDLVAEKRLELRRGTWQGRRQGRLPFSTWATEWWEVWSADPDRSPTTLANAHGRLRRHLRPWFGDRPIERIGPADVRRWQTQLASQVGYDTVVACRSLLLRIFQFAMDEGAIDANPVRKVPPPKRRADPEKVFGAVKRRALTPEEAGRLLACFPLFWWDHVITFLGTGLRFGELAGLRRRWVHLDRPMPILQVGPTRYQAGRFGSGFKPRPKSDAGIREVPLAPLVVEALRRQIPPGNDPGALVFTGPGGGGGHHGGPGVLKGTRTVLSRHNFRRTHHAAVAKLTDRATELPSTAARILKVLRARGPLSLDQLVIYLAEHGRAIRPATVQRALGELHAADLAAALEDDQASGWGATPSHPDPLLEAVDLHGAHDFRHTFATWLEDAGVPARVIDEVMGHEATSRTGQRGSAMGAHYRHTTTEMAGRVAAAVQQRLMVVLQVAEQTLESRPDRATLRML